MKKLTALLFAFLAGSAQAAEPSYTCNPDRGCLEMTGPIYDIGRGVKLTLPSGWKFFTYPTAPLPEMAGLREIRATKDDMVIAITPIPNVDKHAFTEAKLCEMMAQAGSSYVSQSKEQSVSPVPFSSGDATGCRVSFSAANPGEKPFGVLETGAMPV